MKKKKVVLLSGYNNTTNTDNSAELEQYLIKSGFAYGIAEGCYKGVRESSFVVILDSLNDFNPLLRLVNKYNQESIVYINENREGYLYNINKNSMSRLGLLKSFTAKEFDLLRTDITESYTKFNGYYWVLHPEL